MRAALALCFLAAQLGMMVYARFDPARYFTWAPHDAQNEYAIHTRVNGIALSEAEMRSRYGLAPTGVDPRAIEHVLRTVRQYHESYGAGEDARARVTYTINGGPEQVWQWPPR